MSSESSLFGIEFWTAAELATVLTISVQRVNQLEKLGVLPKRVHSRYAAKESVTGYIRFIQKETKTHSREAQMVRKLELQNEAQEIKLKQQSGELIRVDEAERAWQSRGRKIRDMLENVPDRLSGPLAAESNQDKVHALLKSELRVVLMELAGGQQGTMQSGPAEEVVTSTDAYEVSEVRGET